MNIFPSGLACEDDSDAYAQSKLESCINEKNKGEKETEQRISGVIMDFEQQHNNNNNNNRNGFEVEFEEEVDFEIWPVEHPMEPPDEDRPVKCPMPESSVINEEGKREKRLAESLRRTAEETAANKQRKEESDAVADRPVRAVRKRHHTLTGGDDHVIAPLTRAPPLPPPLPAQNFTIFQMLQQLDKFES